MLDLKAFLAALVANSGNKGAMEKAIWAPSVRTKSHSGPTRRVASLPLEAAVAYGLLDGGYAVTSITQFLAVLDPPRLFDEFARHILVRCGGLRVVEAVQEMKAEGLVITGDSIAVYLTDHGFRVTIHNTAINSMRMWLEKAGVFEPRSWDPDVLKLEQLVGLGRSEIAALVGLDEEQQAFLLALCRTDPKGKTAAAAVRELAEQILGRRIARDSLPKRVLSDLKALGYVDYTSGGGVVPVSLLT